MKKKMILYKGERAGSVNGNIFYIDGSPISDLFKGMEVVEREVELLKVYQMDNEGNVDKDGKMMEVQKKNETAALVRDEYDRVYLAVISRTDCSTFLDVVITDEDRKEDTEKKWIIMRSFSD